MADLIKKYTGRFQALWNNHFHQMEAREHRKNTIGLDPTPEEEIKIEELKEWFKNQCWDKEERDRSSRADSE